MSPICALLMKTCLKFGLGWLLFISFNSHAISPISVVCPCTFTPVNQTYSLANFFIVGKYGQVVARDIAKPK